MKRIQCLVKQSLLPVKVFITVMSGVILVHCQNGEVKLTSLDIKVNGISFDPLYQNFTTRNLKKFSLQGRCSPEIVALFFRIDPKSEWESLSPTYGSLQCATTGTFQFDAELAPSSVTSSSDYIAPKGGQGAKLKIEFYGKTKEYSSQVVSIIVQQILGTGHDHLSSSPQSVLKGASFKIRGSLKQTPTGPAPLSSNSYTLRHRTSQTR